MGSKHGQHSGQKKRNVNNRSRLGKVSITLHNVCLENEKEDLPVVVGLIKTYNSAARCAYKHFSSIGLAGMMKSHRNPESRGNASGNFMDFRIVDGHPVYQQCPDGMSYKMWLEMRRESYSRKRMDGLRRTNRFWQIDKDMGYPISGTTGIVSTWLKDRGYELDSVLLHDAVMRGYENHISFEKRRSRFHTAKNAPSFGDIEARSRKDISREEFQVSRNSSITVTGRRSSRNGGNPKFRLDYESMTLNLVFRRRHIGFSFKGNRFSRNGLRTISDLSRYMAEGRIPVTVTLVRLGNGRFNAILTYSPEELASLNRECIPHRKGIVSSIYATDESLCHVIVDTSRNNAVLHSRIYNIPELVGETRNRGRMEQLRLDGKFRELRSLEGKIENRRRNEMNSLVKSIFATSRSYGVSRVVVESNRFRTKGNFNKSLIEFSPEKIGKNGISNCFVKGGLLAKSVKSQCSRNGMEFSKVDGSFIQMRAIMESGSMTEALRRAASYLIDRDLNNSDISLTDWSRLVQDPSMLDWVKHLLHNRRTRQARWETRRIFRKMAVEKAVSLVDNRTRCGSEEKGRHSQTGCHGHDNPILV